MAKRCKHGRKADGRCRKTPKRGNLSGIVKTCVRYKRTSRGLRCAEFVHGSGCPPYVGQRKGYAGCPVRSRKRGVSHGHCSMR
jgi:hypothetical protein